MSDITDRSIANILKRDFISSQTCERIEELCKLRYHRLMDMQEILLFETLEKLCAQAARYAKERENDDEVKP